MAKKVASVIDYGTTNSGCIIEYHSNINVAEGYLLKRNPAKYGDYAKQPTFLLVNKSFYHEVLCKNGTLQLEEIGKDPSKCLIGTEAEDYFNRLNGESVNDWVVFSDMKMKLYDSDTDMLEGSDGCLYKLTFIIAIYFAVFKLEVERHFTEKGLIYGANDIEWAMTIPAIWDDSAKRKMEEVSRMVFGRVIAKVLEPEAAAFHIAYQKNLDLKPGQRLLVVDSGGGTTDIVGLVIREDGGKVYTEECIRSMGNNKAGSDIDNAFWEFLAVRLNAVHNIQSCQSNAPAMLFHTLIESAWQDNPKLKIIMRHWWHSIKHEFNTVTEEKTFEIKIPVEYLKWLYVHHKDLASCLHTGLDVRPLTVDVADFIKKVYEPTIQQITQVVVEAVGKLDHGTFDYIFLVGGTGSIKLLASEIRRQIGTERLYFADESGQTRFVRGGTILYGAAYMVINGISIRRISKKYYYVRMCVPLPGQLSVEEAIKIRIGDCSKTVEDVLDRYKKWLFLLANYHNLEVSEYYRILDSEKENFVPFPVMDRVYCPTLKPVCWKDKPFTNFRDSATLIDPRWKVVSFQIWSSDEIVLFPCNTFQDSPKAQLEASIDIDCSVEKDVHFGFDFNEVAENSYFTVKFFRNDGSVYEELTVDRVCSSM